MVDLQAIIQDDGQPDLDRIAAFLLCDAYTDPILQAGSWNQKSDGPYRKVRFDGSQHIDELCFAIESTNKQDAFLEPNQVPRDFAPLWQHYTNLWNCQFFGLPQRIRNPKNNPLNDRFTLCSNVCEYAAICHVGAESNVCNWQDSWIM